MCTARVLAAGAELDLVSAGHPARGMRLAADVSLSVLGTGAEVDYLEQFGASSVSSRAPSRWPFLKCESQKGLFLEQPRAAIPQPRAVSASDRTCWAARLLPPLFPVESCPGPPPAGHSGQGGSWAGRGAQRGGCRVGGTGDPASSPAV